VTASLWTYGGGIPRYLGMWLVLAPVMVAGLVAFGARRGAVVAAALTTLPSIARNPPAWLTPPWRAWLLAAGLVAVAVWLLGRIVGPGDGGGVGVGGRRAVDWRAVVALVGLALALRVPLAWWDPGISQIGTSTEVAARQLLHGHNPYAGPNRLADYGYYQYPAGTLLLHTPLVAVVPRSVAGEQHLGVRATLWLSEALAVAFLAWAGARLGRPRAGLAAAFAYAVGPTLVRESGLTVANDLILALLVAATAVALALDRHRWAAVAAGLAIAVKPPAALLVPLLWAAVGPATAAIAAAIPVALQLPFLLTMAHPVRQLRGIAEPASRSEPLAILRADSLWWPVYRHFGNGTGVLRAIAYAGLAASIALAVWCGRQLRRRGATPGRAAACVALPLLASYLLAPVQRTNYQDWYLTAFLLCVGLTVRAREPAPSPG
jgi:Glycosyltransferase family 87